VSSKKSVLVIEDDAPIAEFLRGLLENLDQQVVVARDGQEGLDRVRSSPPDLILLDLSLPLVSGRELARQLKTDPTTRQIPVIAVTGGAPIDDDPDDQDRLDAVVEKPFEVRELEDKLLTFLERVS
jgi:two-component system phosphate regulon response regulator PhoB